MINKICPFNRLNDCESCELSYDMDKLKDHDYQCAIKMIFEFGIYNNDKSLSLKRISKK